MLSKTLGVAGLSAVAYAFLAAPASGTFVPPG